MHIDQHIQQLTSYATHVSEGRFELDVASALEKMAESDGKDPAYILCMLCSGLAALQGEQVWIKNLKGGLLLSLKKPTRDFTPTSLAELALGQQGLELKAFGLGLVCAHKIAPQLCWVDWGEQTQVVCLGQPGACPPPNPWGHTPAVGVWLRATKNLFQLSDALFQVVAEQLYHLPVVVRWNRFTLGLTALESQEDLADAEYLCLHPDSDGVMGVRPRTETIVDIWGSVDWQPVRNADFSRREGTVRWVDGPDRPHWEECRGYPFRPSSFWPRRQRFYRGSMLITMDRSGGSLVVPVHRGLKLRGEELKGLPPGLTVYAPADMLVTDLTHQSLVHDEHFEGWQQRVLARVLAACQRMLADDSLASLRLGNRSKGLRWSVITQGWRRYLSHLPPVNPLTIDLPGYWLSALLGMNPETVWASLEASPLYGEKACVVRLMVECNQQLAALWAGLDHGPGHLNSAGNPCYDLVAACYDADLNLPAICISQWRGGQLLHQWVRDELGALDPGPPPPPSSGALVVEILDLGHSCGDSLCDEFATLLADPGSLPVRNGRPGWRVPGLRRAVDLACKAPLWRRQWDKNFFPKLGEFGRLASKFVIEMTNFRSPDVLKAWPPQPGNPGFYLELTPSLHCTLEGQLHTQGRVHCDFAVLAWRNGLPRETPVLALYRFGVMVGLLSHPCPLEALALYIDATHWELNRPLEEQLQQHVYSRIPVGERFAQS